MAWQNKSQHQAQSLFLQDDNLGVLQLISVKMFQDIDTNALIFMRFKTQVKPCLGNSWAFQCLILSLLPSTACIPQRQQINLMYEQIMAESLLKKKKKDLSRVACGKKQKLQCRKKETAGTRATADVR